MRTFSVLAAIESQHPGQVGLPKLPGEQHKHGERASESHDFLQNASSSDTLQVLAGVQEEKPRSLRVVLDEHPRKWKRLEELARDNDVVDAVRPTEEFREHLQSDKKRLQLRVRVDSQLTRGVAQQTENRAKENEDGLRRL